MKKLFYFFTPFMAVLFSHIPAYAAGVQWPPPAADIPLVAYDSDVWENVFAPSMKLSMGAFTNTGFKILGVIISVALVGSIFMRLFADKLKFNAALDSRAFNRNVKKADSERNFDAMVDDKVIDMRVSHAAKKRFRAQNPQADLEEKIYQRQVSYQADIAFLREPPELAIEKNKANREISFQGSTLFRSRNPNYTHKQAVHNRRIANNVDTDFKRNFSDEILENRTVNAELNRGFNRREMERKREERKQKKAGDEV